MPTENELHAFDNYLHCHAYSTNNPDDKGFHRFEHDGLYYFAWLEKGRVILRSEGYDNEPGRENGIQSVLNNLADETLWAPTQEEDGRWVLLLFAKNNQEIARTCSCATREEALQYLPSARALAAVPEHQRKEDDYLACSVYASHSADTCAGHDDFVCFQDATTGKHYFAWLSPSGKVILRSEGYPTTSARENGVESVIRNRDNRELYEVMPIGNHVFVRLKAANHQEIGRSCPHDNVEAFWLLVDEHSSHRKEDDYLVCREYEEKISARCGAHKDFICFFHPATKKYYFAWVSATNQIILRSEGYPTEGARDKGIQAVVTHRENRDNFSVEENRGVHFLVLKAPNHQEIGRSCPKASPLAVWALLEPAAPVVAAAPVIAAAPITEAAPPPVAVAPARGGFNWWWLLPLLLIPLFFLWRGCGNEPAPSAAVEPTPAPAVVDTTPHCGLKWILFEFDKDFVVDSGRAELMEVAQMLKDNPSYMVDLKGFTDEKGSYDYNSSLSRRRALNCEKVLLEQGIDSARIEADAMSESDPAAVNTTDDSGRHFNRRVEVYILDANGKRVCRSIKPDIPYNLRTQ
jgi:uncharacterized protein YegP (UPF0339 family)